MSKKIKGSYLLNAVGVALVFALLTGLFAANAFGTSTTYIQGICTTACYTIIMVTSLNLVVGFMGEFSLGHAGFVSVGAYVSAIVSGALAGKGLSDLGLFLIALLVGGLAAGIMGVLVGIPALRLRGDYLAIATLGFAEIIRALVQLEAFAPVTNGSQLLRGFPYFTDTFMPFVIVGICIAVVVLLINSTYGRAFKAIRDDEIAAEAMGINLAHHKRMAFIISSFFAGISGALLAMYQTTVQANTFKSAMTYEILLIVVIGGIGSISGSVIGSLLFVATSEWWLRGLDSGKFLGISAPGVFRNGFRLVVFSIVIMVVVLFFRKGIMGDRELPQVIDGWRKKLRAKKTAKQEVASE